MRAVSAPTVVIIAAGEGTRMRSALPKVLHPLCGRPLVLWPVIAALQAGAGKVVVVDNPKRRLEDRLPEGVETAVQPAPNGTGGAVQAATEHIDPDTTVVILAGDVPLITAEAIAALVQAHEQSDAAGTMATMELDDPGQYGRVVRDRTGNVEKVVEAKSGEGDATPEQLEIREVNTGIYAFDGQALLDALDNLTADNAQGELYLPDVLPQLTHEGKTIAAHLITDPTLTLGINDRVQLAEVRAIAQKRIHDEHGRNGVTILDPASTLIDADVTIGQDTIIEPGTSLKGNTTIGADCSVGPHTTIIDSQLGDGVSIPHSLPGAGPRRRPRHDRSVRLPAPRRPSAPERQGRRVRRDQEQHHRQGFQGPAPLVHRRRRHRGEHEHRGEQHHRELRRPQQTPHDDRQQRENQRGYGLRRPRHSWRWRIDGSG